MKNIKFTIGIIVSFLLICMASTNLAVNAAPKTAKVSVGFNKSAVATNGNIKEIITLTDFVGVETGIRACKFVVAYDSTKFDYIGIHPLQGDLAEFDVASTINKLVILFADTANGSSPIFMGPALEINFKAKNSTGDNNFSISSGATVSFLDCSNPGATPASALATARNVTPSFSNGQVVRIILRGDISGNGIIEISDLTAIKAYLLKINSFSALQNEAGDIFNKGKVSIADLLAIKKDLIGVQSINEYQ